MQFWNDIHLQNGWKIQQHSLTGHHRLIDPGKTRRAWGSHEHCLQQINLNAPPQDGKQKTFLLLHGLGRSHFSMTTLQEKLQQAGHLAYTMEYSSLISPIEQHSTNLKSILAQLHKQEVFVVTHSYGGIILRHSSLHPNRSSRPKGAVLMAAPNQGAKIVDTLKKTGLHHLLGPSGKRLGSSPADLPKTLPAPACDFITIAGSKPAKIDNLPFGIFFSERSDGVVCESSTRLEGASGHFRQEASHTFIMDSEESLRHILDFCHSK
jgi:pimeloyl-ACP methyl ester carboxylesterase